MTNLNPKKICLPVTKNTLWNHKNPVLNLSFLDPLNTQCNQSYIANVFNLSGTFLGVGLYVCEANQIVYFWHENLKPQQILFKILKASYYKKKQLNLNTSAYRLINHKHDQLPGVIIEVYNDIYIIKTFDSGADLLIDDITQILVKDYNASAVLLKNHFLKRQQTNLLMCDQILAGGLSSDIIDIKEKGFTYNYDTKNNLNLFCCESRHLRNNLNKSLINSTQKNKILILGGLPSEIISQEATNNILVIKDYPFNKSDLLNITENLRSLFNNKSMDYSETGLQNLTDTRLYGLKLTHAYIVQPQLNFTQKNKTAIFHLYYNLIKLLNDNALLFIKAHDWVNLKQLIKHVCKKSNKKMVVHEVQNPPDDFCVSNKKLPAGINHITLSIFS